MLAVESQLREANHSFLAVVDELAQVFAANLLHLLLDHLNIVKLVFCDNYAAIAVHVAHRTVLALHVIIWYGGQVNFGHFPRHHQEVVVVANGSVLATRMID